MPKFMLILHDVPGALADVSPEEMQAVIARYVAWGEALGRAGKHHGGHKLTDEGGRTMRKEGERIVVVDGPYAEAREVVGGYFLIEAADYAEATALSEGCPHLDCGRIEVRQVDEMEG